MAWSTLELGYDMIGRGFVYGVYTATGATAGGAFSTPFKQVRHVSISNNVFSVPATYAATAYNVDVTVKELSAGTYMVYGE